MAETVRVRIGRFELMIMTTQEVRKHLEDRGLDPRTATATTAPDGSGDVVYLGDKLEKAE